MPTPPPPHLVDEKNKYTLKSKGSSKNLILGFLKGFFQSPIKGFFVAPFGGVAPFEGASIGTAQRTL